MISLSLMIMTILMSQISINLIRIDKDNFAKQIFQSLIFSKENF